MTAIAGLKRDRRCAAVRPYQNKVCDVTWRSGTYGQWRTDRFRVVGAAHHATNGNSTGDLIVAPAHPDHVFVVGAERVPLKSISLANLKCLEVA